MRPPQAEAGVCHRQDGNERSDVAIAPMDATAEPTEGRRALR
jgi:hypothetical protein